MLMSHRVLKKLTLPKSYFFLPQFLSHCNLLISVYGRYIKFNNNKKIKRKKRKKCILINFKMQSASIESSNSRNYNVEIYILF